MMLVFFIGYGTWWLKESNGGATGISSSEDGEKGYFRLSDQDELAYRKTQNTVMVNKLLPCFHPDSAFLRMVQEGKLSNEDAERCYFEICKVETVYPPVASYNGQPACEYMAAWKESRSKPEIVTVHYDLVVELDTLAETEITQNNLNKSNQITEFKDVKNSEKSEKAEMNTMKALATMAWLLSINKNTFRVGGRPNAEAIRKAIEPLIETAFPDNTNTFKSFEKKISAALALFDKDELDFH